VNASMTLKKSEVKRKRRRTDVSSALHNTLAFQTEGREARNGKGARMRTIAIEKLGGWKKKRRKPEGRKKSRLAGGISFRR